MERSLLVVLAIAVTCVLAGCFLFHTDVSGDQAREMVASGATLVDVRTPEEFASGHIEGAMNIPVQHLERRLGDLPNKQATIVVYCRSGSRSARAEKILRAAGYEHIHNLGAMSRW